jgi:hypothetical protein
MANLTARMVEKLHHQYEAGDPGAILDAIDFCARAGMPMPVWLAEAYCARFEDWSMYQVKSLDEAFGVRARREGARIPDRERRERLKPRVVLSALRLRERKGKGKPLPYDMALFECVGRELKIKASDAHDLFYDADNHWRDALRAVWKMRKKSE